MFLRFDHNEYGTPITVCRCDTCQVEFTVTPMCSRERATTGDWTSCLSSECDSYDESRDADKLFDESPESFTRRPVRPAPEA